MLWRWFMHAELRNGAASQSAACNRMASPGSCTGLCVLCMPCRQRRPQATGRTLRRAGRHGLHTLTASLVYRPLRFSLRSQAATTSTFGSTGACCAAGPARPRTSDRGGMRVRGARCARASAVKRRADRDLVKLCGSSWKDESIAKRSSAVVLRSGSRARGGEASAAPASGWGGAARGSARPRRPIVCFLQSFQRPRNVGQSRRGRAAAGSLACHWQATLEHPATRPRRLRRQRASSVCKRALAEASAACGLRLRSDEKRVTGCWRSANSPTQRFRFSQTYLPCSERPELLHDVLQLFFSSMSFLVWS